MECINMMVLGSAERNLNNSPLAAPSQSTASRKMAIAEQQLVSIYEQASHYQYQLQQKNYNFVQETL
jgi:hypothetical protein